MQWSVVTWRGASLIRSLPYTPACTAKSASGTAGGFIGHQPVTPFTFSYDSQFFRAQSWKACNREVEQERPEKDDLRG
jgi:hypothetical protein